MASDGNNPAPHAMWMNPKGAEVVYASCISLGAAATVVCLRIFTRVHTLHSPVRSDDWLLLVAVLCSLGETVAMCYEVKNGLGLHIQEVSPAHITEIFRFLWISIIFYNVSLILTKISLLLSFLRVFPHPRIILASKLSIGFLVGTAGYWLVSTCLLCQPLAFWWDKSIKGGHCINAQPIWISHAILNIVTDLVIIIIPMPVLSTLNLANRAKLWLIFVFALGLFVTIVSVVRLRILLDISPDFTYSSTGAALLSTLENNTAIFCASLPPLRSFVRRYAPQLMSRAERTNLQKGEPTLSVSAGLESIALKSPHQPTKAATESTKELVGQSSSTSVV
ncbi:hypothetical protein PVAG01_02273 [Phlyctema vagabunda]|uniref:Rhodopsin domain-containing protein n=1 Tax=Phlyctema vagabunda TaxID=108571 RepID=A0ABR4PQR6_9HELO